MKENVVYELSKRFAIRMVKLYDYLRKEKHEFIMSKQIFRSGTSIGANLAESVFASSDADFINKMQIALKEANETKYWLELLIASDKVNQEEFDSLNTDLSIIIGTMVNMINKLKAKR